MILIYYIWNWIDRDSFRLKGEIEPLSNSILLDNLKLEIMKEIKLTQGRVALVDDEDFEYLNQFKWYAHKNRNTYYAERMSSPGKVMIRMHRVIMNLLPGEFVDHRDCNGLNNQKDNLRLCNKSQNCMNRRYINKTGYLGVYTSKKRFHASIRVNKKSINLGCFKSAEEAAMARDLGSIKYFGQFANLNFK